MTPDDIAALNRNTERLTEMAATMPDGAEYLWRRCSDCGGDDQTHLNVAAYVARSTSESLIDVITWPCTATNRYSRYLHSAEERPPVTSPDRGINPDFLAFTDGPTPARNHSDCNRPDAGMYLTNRHGIDLPIRREFRTSAVTEVAGATYQQAQITPCLAGLHGA